MSQHYRQDSRHSYNPRYQRQSNRGQYHNNSYKEQENFRVQRREGNRYENYGYQTKQEGREYKTKQDGQYENDKYRSGSYYKHSSGGNYTPRDQQPINRYNQYKDEKKQTEQRAYSRDVRPYRQHEDRYEKKYESKYQNRSRSRQRNYHEREPRDYIKRTGQYQINYSQKSGEYQSKSYNAQSYSNYNRQEKQFNEPPKIIEIDSHFQNEKQPNIKISQKNQSSNKKYQREPYTENLQKRYDQSKNFISIEVKSRQKSPNTNQKRSHKSQSSLSKSLSKSRRSKEKSKNKHHKKNRSSSSSSRSSSESSSSSSSSSNRSSSSSSSHSSSSSYSQSIESRKHKNKDYKQFYNRNSSQQKYPTQYYSNRQRYQDKYQSKRPYEISNTADQIKGYERKVQKQFSVKQIKVQRFVTTEQKPQQQWKPSRNYEGKDPRKPQFDVSISQKERIQPLSISDKAPQYELNRPKTYQQRDSFRKYNNYNKFLNDSYNQKYQNSRPIYSQNQYQNKPLNVGQQSQISESSMNQVNIELNVPSYPNRIYSSQNPKIPLGQENDYQRRNSMNQPFRRPYVNSYQNYPQSSGNVPTTPYQNNFGNSPYQRYNQGGFPPQRPFEKNFYQNRNLDGQQQNISTNNFNSIQNQLPYYTSFQPQMRRVNSEMVGQRKGSYFQQLPENKQNQLNKSQINKPQTEKQDLALIQQTFKRQQELKKIKELIPCSKTLELIQKAKQNLAIPSIKPNFLLLDLFKEMSDFKKQTMNSNLRSILEEDFENKYNEEKSKVFQNLRLLNLDEKQSKSNQQILEQKQKTQEECKQDTGKMDVQNNQNPEVVQRPHQFIWKKPQMSQNLRLLKSNIQNLRKASSSLSQLSRKFKIKESHN